MTTIKENSFFRTIESLNYHGCWTYGKNFRDCDFMFSRNLSLWAGAKMRIYNSGEGRYYYRNDPATDQGIQRIKRSAYSGFCKLAIITKGYMRRKRNVSIDRVLVRDLEEIIK